MRQELVAVEHSDPHALVWYQVLLDLICMGNGRLNDWRSRHHVPPRQGASQMLLQLSLPHFATSCLGPTRSRPRDCCLAVDNPTPALAEWSVLNVDDPAAAWGLRAYHCAPIHIPPARHQHSDHLDLRRHRHCPLPRVRCRCRLHACVRRLPCCAVHTVDTVLLLHQVPSRSTAPARDRHCRRRCIAVSRMQIAR